MSHSSICDYYKMEDNFVLFMPINNQDVLFIKYTDAIK